MLPAPSYDDRVSDTAAPIALVPLTGAWHLHHPRWNVVTVRDALEAYAPTSLWTTALAADADPRDGAEIALPWTVVPWATARGTPLRCIGVASRGETADLERHLSAYPAARALLDTARAALTPLRTLLPSPLDLPRLIAEVIPAIAADLTARIEAFGDGPATDDRLARARTAVARLQGDSMPEGRAALLIDVDAWPAVTFALDEAGIAWRVIDEPPVSDAARERALLDVAWRGASADPVALRSALQAIPAAEARFLEAQLLLAHAHPHEALTVLEQAQASDFREPYLLPGLLLARLGQLRDVALRRDAAIGAYRAALALGWIPPEAREAAEAGLRAAFTLPEAS
jgi:hypothetical protein